VPWPELARCAPPEQDPFPACFGRGERRACCKILMKPFQPLSAGVAAHLGQSPDQSLYRARLSCSRH
jgi:hypothetical protein